MNDEEKIDYVKRCIRHEQQITEQKPIVKFPVDCLDDLDDECYVSDSCMARFDDMSKCVEINPGFTEITSEGDWSLVDACKGNKNIGDISNLVGYFEGK